jgi:hypothetical protein
MKIRHTKSSSGRTHRLTITHPASGNYEKIPGKVETVTLRYREAPRYDDQVQGDLIRKYWREGGTVSPIGRIPDSPSVDPALDEEEATRGRLTLAQVADVAMERFHLHMEADEVRALSESAVEADRKTR